MNTHVSEYYLQLTSGLLAQKTCEISLRCTHLAVRRISSRVAYSCSFTICCTANNTKGNEQYDVLMEA